MVDQSQDEVLRFGAGGPRRPLSDGARRHPLVVGTLVLVLVIGAVVFVKARQPQPIALPTVSNSLVDENSELRAGGAWGNAPDGRPNAPPSVQVDTAFVFDGVPGGGATVIGIEGPGVTAASADPNAVNGSPANLHTMLSSTVDCDAVTLPLDPNSYALTVRTNDGGRTRTGPIKADTAARAWAGHATRACGAWLARRDLTVSAVSGRSRPLRPAADLAVTVTNSGTHDAVFAFDAKTFSTWATPTSTQVVNVAAGSSRVVRTGVTVPTCDRTTESKYLTGPPLDTDEVLGVVATAGGAGTKPVRGDTPWLEGTGAGGIVFSEGARTSTEAILQSACGGLTPFAVVIDNGGVHYDAATRLLRVDIEVDGTPRKISDVVLTTDKATDTGVAKDAEFVALWTKTARLRPDFTGQSLTSLTYRAPKKSVCGRAPVLLPGFQITARVPEPTGVRTVQFGDFGVPWQESVVKNAICP